MTLTHIMFPISGDKLSNLIPQKSPFVFISSLEEVTDTSCKTIFQFNTNHVLCNHGMLTPAGLLENMAQSSGCKMGYDDFMNGKKTTVGFIGEVRDFICLRLPVAGEELTTEIIVESKVFNMVTIISGRVLSGGEVIASCKMKVFFAPEAEEEQPVVAV